MVLRLFNTNVRIKYSFQNLSVAMDREGGTTTLQSLVEENLSQYEDRVAILYDTGGSKEFVTYKEMWSEASLVNIFCKKIP